MQIILVITINLFLFENTLGKSRQQIARPRIIGGENALIENYPFMASVVLKFHKNTTIFSGGATIIGKDWAITAAHCVFDFGDGIVSSRKAFVRSNTSFWETDFAFRRDHLVVEYIIHEKYVYEEEDYDIALLSVLEPFNGRFEIPITYAEKDYKYKEGSKVVTLGWGTTEKNVEPYTVHQLRGVDITIIEQSRCAQIYSKHRINISKRMLCAGAPGKDACVNDSGGPLIQWRNLENMTLIGLVSWGVECASTNFPGVYTRLSQFEEWITAAIRHPHRSPKIRSDDIMYSYELPGDYGRVE